MSSDHSMAKDSSITSLLSESSDRLDGFKVPTNVKRCNCCDSCGSNEEEGKGGAQRKCNFNRCCEDCTIENCTKIMRKVAIKAMPKKPNRTEAKMKKHIKRLESRNLYLETKVRMLER